MNVAELLNRLTQKDRTALARLLTLVSRGEELSAIRTRLAGVSASTSRIIAITGSAGVGKSTLIGKLIEFVRSKDQSIAVLACDPQSPLTGGALLGDRFRMPSRPNDEGVFIRSLATAAGHEAIAEHLDLMIGLLKAFGFDLILLETVGAGQGDTAVRQVADLVVLLLQPEAGDDIQWEKAGLLEVADVVVIHKADLPGADRVEAQVRSLLNLPGCREVPVVQVSAAKSEGLRQLYELLTSLASRRYVHERNAAELLRRVQELVAERFHARKERVDAIAANWQRTRNDTDAVRELLKVLCEAD